MGVLDTYASRQAKHKQFGFNQPNDYSSMGQWGNFGDGPAGTDNGYASMNPSGNTKDKTGFNPYIQGLNVVSGLADAYLGYKALNLAEDQFAFTKGSFNRNLANQASLTNTQLEAQQRARLAAEGQYDRSTEAGRSAMAKDLESYLAPRRVSGAPI